MTAAPGPPDTPRRFPDHQPAGDPGQPLIDPVSDSPRVFHRWPRMVRWRCLGPNPNQRWSGGQGRNRTIDTRIFNTTERSVRHGLSRRPGTLFRLADRTAPPDRTHAEPEPGTPDLGFASPIRFNGLTASRPNALRTGGRAWCARPESIVWGAHRIAQAASTRIRPGVFAVRRALIRISTSRPNAVRITISRSTENPSSL